MSLSGVACMCLHPSKGNLGLTLHVVLLPLTDALPTVTPEALAVRTAHSRANGSRSVSKTSFAPVKPNDDALIRVL